MLPTLTGLPAPLVLLVAAIVLAAESGLMVGIVLPGATTALSLGVLSRLGVVGFWTAVVAVAAASLLGSQLAFLAARRREPAGFGLLRRRAEPLLARAADLLSRWPATGAAVGRLVGGVRTLVPVVAARAGVSHGRFAAGDVPAAGGWAVLLVALGHVAGAALDQVRLAVGLVGPPLVLATLAVHFGRKWVRSGTRRRKERACRTARTGEPSAPEDSPSAPGWRSPPRRPDRSSAPKRLPARSGGPRSP